MLYIICYGNDALASFSLGDVNLMQSENSIVAYKLAPKEKPVNPDKLWLGKVIRYCGREYLLVELVEPGYEGCREYILVNQIVGVNYETEIL